MSTTALLWLTRILFVACLCVLVAALGIAFGRALARRRREGEAKEGDGWVRRVRERALGGRNLRGDVDP